MPVYDLAWFLATLFGPKYPSLTAAQFDFALAMSEAELVNVLCWCPKVYPHALAIKISLVLDGAGLGQTATAVPATVATTGDYTAYVIEDEVFDVRRKYGLKPKPKQTVVSTPVGTLEGILARCKPPLRMGAFLAAGINGATDCCGSMPGDKVEFLTGEGHGRWG